MCFFVKCKAFVLPYHYVQLLCVCLCVCVCVLSLSLCVCVASGKNSPSSDFCKRLGTFLGPRLSQLARDITEFVNKSKTTR